MLLIARFADARLDWKEEGISISMSHDYLSRIDRGHVAMTIETQQPSWNGEILVRSHGAQDSVWGLRRS